MYLLRRLLDMMTQDYAITFRPLNLAEVKRLSIALKKNNLCIIPLDYANFLCWSDGLVWRNLELFSVYSYERPDTVYPHPTLLEVQKKHIVEDAFPRLVRKDIPLSVSHIQYDIALAEIEDYKVE